MVGLERALRGRRRLVLVLWLGVFLACVPFAVKQADGLTESGFDVPGSESLAVQETIATEFPGIERSPLAAVLVPDPAADAEAVAAARRRVALAVAQQPRIAMRASPAGPRRLRAPILLPLQLDVEGDGEAVDLTGDLRDRLPIGEPVDGVRTYLVGYGALWSAMSERSEEDLARAELIGFPLVAIILLVVFGSLTAAALPVGLGVAAVTITGAAIYGLSQLMSMSVFVTSVASMVGIGVAVDYSLFIVARYREELRAGRSREEALSRAMATSGLAVLFSGVTVIASLAGLFLLDSNVLRSMAIGAILVVTVAMLGSATLLPVLIRIAGRRLDQRSRGAQPEGEGFWQRWTARIMRRPVVSLACSAGLLLLMTAPLLDLQLTVGVLRQFPADSEPRVGARAAAEVAEPGRFSPIRVVVTPAQPLLVEGEQSPAVRGVMRRLQGDPAVARVEGPWLSRGADAVLFDVITHTDGESALAEALVERLRSQLPVLTGDAARVQVGGSTAGLLDLVDLVRGGMWKVILFVIVVSYVVLLFLLRSVLLPLKAVFLNLLSVGAAFGVLVAVFQWGWLDGVLGLEASGGIVWLTPPVVLAVVFGLSMDYEVFLLSRIRERYETTGDTTTAVAGGLASSARTITSAALIMVVVFAAFVGTGVTVVQQIGVGLAVAIAIDATLVRLVLMPATMQLFGRWNWWLPQRLARVLPKGSFEQMPSTSARSAETPKES